MSTVLDQRSLLMKLIKTMSDSDARQILAYAAGYEAGKINQISLYPSKQSNKPPQTT